MSGYFKRATAVSPYVLFLVDASNRPIGKTGAAPAVTLSKDGAAFAAVAGSATEISSGFYKVSLSAAELDARIVAVRATASGADPWNDIFLTDTLLVSEVSGGSGLGFGPVSVGESVWTRPEKERALAQLDKLLRLLKGVQGTVETAATDSQEQLQALRAQGEQLQTAVEDSRRVMADLGRQYRSVVEGFVRQLPAELRETQAEQLQAHWSRVEQGLVRHLQGLLREHDDAKQLLEGIDGNLQVAVRMLTASLSTEQLESIVTTEGAPT